MQKKFKSMKIYGFKLHKLTLNKNSKNACKFKQVQGKNWPNLLGRNLNVIFG